MTDHGESATTKDESETSTDTDDEDTETDGKHISTSKVDRLITKHGLDGVDDELVDRWTAQDESRLSLRELASLFNRRLLEAALEDADIETIEGEVENIFTLLTDDDVTAGVRTEIQTRLERDGIDVERLESDFVSHQAVYNYLTKYRGVSREKESVTPAQAREQELETINRLQSRTVAVTTNAISRLTRADRLAISDPEVLVDVQVFCADCGRSYNLDELLLENPTCACDDATLPS